MNEQEIKRPDSFITPAEWRLMEVLWEKGPLKMRALVSALQPLFGWNRTTVLTLAGRLERKGYIGTERSERAYLYVPLISAKKASRQLIARIADDYFDGDPARLARLASSTDAHELGGRHSDAKNKKSGKKSKSGKKKKRTYA